MNAPVSLIVRPLKMSSIKVTDSSGVSGIPLHWGYNCLNLPMIFAQVSSSSGLADAHSMVCSIERIKVNLRALLAVLTKPGLIDRKIMFSFLYLTAYLATACRSAVLEIA